MSYFGVKNGHLRSFEVIFGSKKKRDYESFWGQHM